MTNRFVALVAKHMPTWQPSVIWDVGALNCQQSIELADAYPESVVFAFEPNPDQWKFCDDAVIGRTNQITVVPFALTDKWGILDYYQMLTANQGASGLFKPSGKYDVIEKMPYKVIRVAAVNFDAAIAMTESSPDMLWLDMQGSELSMLRTIDGRFPPQLRAIWTEMLYGELYEGQCMANDLAAFMRMNGFQLVFEQEVVPNWYGDACFLKI